MLLGLLRERFGAPAGVVLLANTGLLVDLLGLRWGGLWRGTFAGGTSSWSSDESVWFTASRWALSRRRASLVRLALWALRNLVCVWTHHDSVWSMHFLRVSHLMWLVCDRDVWCSVSYCINNHRLVLTCWMFVKELLWELMVWSCVVFWRFLCSHLCITLDVIVPEHSCFCVLSQVTKKI